MNTNTMETYYDEEIIAQVLGVEEQEIADAENEYESVDKESQPTTTCGEKYRRVSC